MTAGKRQPALGRGLAALLGDRDNSTAEEALRTVAIELLAPGPFQPRSAIDSEQLESLAESIRAHGLLQPILVRRSTDARIPYEIIGGERRWRAAQLVPLHDVPILIRAFSDRDAMAAALVENLQRQDLNILEEAEGYRRLMQEFGLTQEMLGEVVGKSRSHVANTLRLLAMPATLRTFVENGSLTAGHARALLTTDDPEKLARTVLARGLNVRQTEILAGKGPAEAKAPRVIDAETETLARSISMQLGLRVSIRPAGTGGQVIIDYRTLDQLESLVRLLNGG